MVLLRPLRMVSMMVSALPPYSQVLSLRLGAPSIGLPLPPAPWQAMQALNFDLPMTDLIGSCVLSDRLRTYCATFSISFSEPTAAPIGGITPWRPFMMVSLMVSGSPPCSQSLSARFGKPLLPRASEPWHCAQ